MPNARPRSLLGTSVTSLLSLLALVLAFGTPATAVPDDAPGHGRQPYAGYLFTYFTGEGTADGEQVHMALSRGNDPLRWQELNDGEPVLASTSGELGVRDPFIIRSPEGDTFFLLATDLKIHGDGDWDRAQRHGSRSIMIWESTDLVNWSEQRSVQVSPPTAGNTWAPEAYWDAEREQYVVYWASKLYGEDDPDDPCGKFITQEKSADLLDTSWDLVAECIGKDPEGGEGLFRGEGPTVFKSNTEGKWYLFIDEFGGRGYVPFETTALASGEWQQSGDYALPSSPRHGTVIPVTHKEYNGLAARWGAWEPTCGRQGGDADI